MTHDLVTTIYYFVPFERVSIKTYYFNLSQRVFFHLLVMWDAEYLKDERGVPDAI